MNQHTEPDVSRSRKRGKTWAGVASAATVVAAVTAILLFRDAANATPVHPCVVIAPASAAAIDW